MIFDSYVCQCLWILLTNCSEYNFCEIKVRCKRFSYFMMHTVSYSKNKWHVITYSTRLLNRGTITLKNIFLLLSKWLNAKHSKISSLPKEARQPLKQNLLLLAKNLKKISLDPSPLISPAIFGFLSVNASLKLHYKNTSN